MGEAQCDEATEETIHEALSKVLSHKACRRLCGLLQLEDSWPDLLARYQSTPDAVEGAIEQVAIGKWSTAKAIIKASIARAPSPSRGKARITTPVSASVPTAPDSAEEKTPQQEPLQDKPLVEESDPLEAASPATCLKAEAQAATPASMPVPAVAVCAEAVLAEHPSSSMEAEAGDLDTAAEMTTSLLQPHGDLEVVDSPEDPWDVFTMPALAPWDMASILSTVQSAVSFVQEECAQLLNSLDFLGQDSTTGGGTTAGVVEEESWFGFGGAWSCPCFGQRRSRGHQ